MINRRLPKFINGGSSDLGIRFDSDPLLEHYNRNKANFSNPISTPTNPNIDLGNNNFNSDWKGGNIAGAAATGILSGVPSPDVNDTAYTRQRAQDKATTNKVIGGVSLVNPIVGAGLKLGTVIGEHTTDEYGQYKSRAGNAIDEMVNPVTGYEGVKNTLKGDSTFSGAVNKLTLGLFGRSDSDRRAQREKENANRSIMADLGRASQTALGNYPVYGNPIAKYGMRYAGGGRLPMPTDDSNTNQLASNVMKYTGDTHANGGIKLDTNEDGNSDIEVEDNEVIKDDMVLSNRLKPTEGVTSYIKDLGFRLKSSDTYADIATKIGKRKGDLEKSLDSDRVGVSEGAQITLERLDDGIDQLFNDQEMNKLSYAKGGKYPDGGIVPIYLKQNPNATSIQNDIKAQLNFATALKFKNSLRGNVAPQVPVNPNDSTSGLSGRTSIVNSYSGIDPRAVQQADSVINIMRPLGKNIYARGGKIKSPIANYWINDPFGGSQRSSYTPGIDNPNIDTSNQQYNPSVKEGLGLGDYKGDLAAVAGTVANQIQIGNLETNYSPGTVSTPRYSYTDRTPYLTNQIQQNFRVANQGLNQSGYGNNQALKANIYAKSLEGVNRALDSELQRKDIFDARYNESLDRNNIINTQIKNQGKLESMNNRNQKRALTQQNIDNLIRSYQGNEAVRNYTKLDKDRAYLALLGQGDTGVGNRLLEQLTPEQRSKLGFYANGGNVYKPRR